MELQSKYAAKMPMDDEKIIELYFERNEKAIEETDFKYRKYLFSVAYNVLRDRLDCEECLNDTYLGAWNAMPPHKPSPLSLFLGKITRQLSIDVWRKKHRSKRGGSEYEQSLDELADCDNEIVCALCLYDASYDDIVVLLLIGSITTV
jgi:RNA polymerase sigma-70 factor (ECF subfamily)